jgi:hypothetical protein
MILSISSDCGQSDQYRKNFGRSGGGSLKKFEKSESACPTKSNSGNRPIQNLIFATKSSYLKPAVLSRWVLRPLANSAIEAHAQCPVSQKYSPNALYFAYPY